MEWLKKSIISARPKEMNDSNCISQLFRTDIHKGLKLLFEDDVDIKERKIIITFTNVSIQKYFTENSNFYILFPDNFEKM